MRESLFSLSKGSLFSLSRDDDDIMAYVRQEEGKENDVAVADIGNGRQEIGLQGFLETINNCSFNHASSHKNGRKQRKLHLCIRTKEKVTVELRGGWQVDAKEKKQSR